jgi:hypothetical protein
MRTPLIIVATVVAAFVGGGDARAQNYPWCANYGGFFGDGGTNCGFTTYEQCLATISGMGGACERNLQYVPPPGPHDAPLHQPRHGRRHAHR